MEQLSTKQIQDALAAVARRVAQSEPLLTEIDTIIGDGDHGIGMREGFSALHEMLLQNQYQNCYDLFRDVGQLLVRVMGGASGVIFGTLFTGGHEVVRDKEALSADDLIAFFSLGAGAIMRRGRAGAGDKTMLDALLPAIDAMRAARTETADVKKILSAAASSAAAGAEATKDMLPRIGRSKNFREKALGYPDPGAISVQIIFEAFAENI